MYVALAERTKFWRARAERVSIFLAHPPVRLLFHQIKRSANFEKYIDEEQTVPK